MTDSIQKAVDKALNRFKKEVMDPQIEKKDKEIESLSVKIQERDKQNFRQRQTNKNPREEYNENGQITE